MKTSSLCFQLSLTLLFVSLPYLCFGTDSIHYNTYSPSTYINIKSHQVEGPIPDLIRRIHNKIGIDYKIELVPMKRAGIKLSEHAINAVHRVSFRKDRVKQIYYSYPVDVVHYNVYVLKSNPLIYKNKTQLSSYTIAVQGPTNNSQVLIEMMKDISDTKIVVTLTSEQALKMLKAKRFGNKKGAVYTSGRDFLAAKKKYNFTNIRLAGIDRRNHYYIAFDKKTVKKEWVNRFNQAMFELYKNGEMQKIYSQYTNELAATLPSSKNMFIPQ